MEKISLSPEDIDRIIAMAWEDRTTFDAIERQFGLKEQEVQGLMRANMKKSSWLMWRKRMTGRKTKHEVYDIDTEVRFKCTQQKNITHNKMSKR